MSEHPSVVLLHGNDEFAIAGHVEKLCAGLGDPSTADMNIARFDGRASLDFEALNTAVNAMPFLSPGRLAVLAHPSSAFSTAEGRKKIIGLLDHIPPTTTLVLVENILLRQDHWLLKWSRSAAPKARILVCMLPRPKDMPGWILQETRKQGGRMEPGAAARLAEMIGEDTRIAAQEITKLLTYVNYQRPVSPQDVNMVSVVSAQESIFDLVDALGQGDGKKGQKMLHRLLEDADAFELWGMVIRQFRLLLQVRELLDERKATTATSTASLIQAIHEALGLHEYVAGKVCDQARHFSMATLESIYHRLLEIDERAKTSQVPLDLALDMLVVELTRPASPLDKP